MGERRYGGPEGETRHDELRRAWFDGWTEGVMWMWGKTQQALRQDGQPESVECSVIDHVSFGTAFIGWEASDNPLTLVRVRDAPERQPLRSHGKIRKRRLTAPAVFGASPHE